MIKNYIPSRREIHREYQIEYLRKDTSGFGFPCDSTGMLLPFENPYIEKNYEWCKEHEDEFEVKGEFRVFKWNYTVPAEGDCICGEHIQLWDQYHGACDCPKCGRWYNLFGQSLINPEYWEEDE